MELSFVVIGYNESQHLSACLLSALEGAKAHGAAEVIYVDGGSTDDSLDLARAAGVDLVLGGEKRRRAAENRNLGLQAAQGQYIQFLDGDMVLFPEWPAAAQKILQERPKVAAVCGRIIERRTSAFYKALQIDWSDPEGEVLYCGGAALHRRDALLKAGGFPEEVAYGEEPLLCWRYRNAHGLKIYHLHEPMVLHDLAYRGFLDYWRRNVRVGRTYAEISGLLSSSQEPFWQRETRSSLRWGILLFLCLLLLLAGPWWEVRVAVLLFLALLLGRKTVQAWRAGNAPAVSLLYAGHTYFAKLGIAWGLLQKRFSTGC